jgi:uncharacterized membrane protein
MVRKIVFAEVFMKYQINETVKMIDGKVVSRVKSSVIYDAAFLTFVVSIIALWAGVTLEKNFLLALGSLLLAFALPSLLIYPIVRFLLGGKDNLAGIFLTIFAQEYLKKNIKKKLDQI